MPSLADLAIGGVLPGVIALVLLAAPWLLWKQRAGGAVRWIAPVAIGLAFIPASVVSNNHAGLWPVNASERALAVVGAAVLFALAVQALGRPECVGRLWAHVLGVLGIAGVGAFGAFAVLIALHPHAVSTVMLIGTVTGAGVWTAGSAMLLARAERAAPGFGVPGRLAISLFGMSLVMLFSSIGVFAQATGGLVAAMTAGAIVGLWRREQTLGAGTYVVPLAVMAYLLIGAWQLSSNPPLGALAVTAALPLVVGGAALFGRRGRVRSIVSWVTVGIVALGAAGWAFSVYADAREASPYGY